MELVGSSWCCLPSEVFLILGGGGGGGGLMLDVELTTTLGGGVACCCCCALLGPNCGGPTVGLACGGALIWPCGGTSTVSALARLLFWPLWWPCGGPRGHHSCNTLIALRTSACSSAARSLDAWAATLPVYNPLARVPWRLFENSFRRGFFKTLLYFICSLSTTSSVTISRRDTSACGGWVVDLRIYYYVEMRERHPTIPKCLECLRKNVLSYTCNVDKRGRESPIAR